MAINKYSKPLESPLLSAYGPLPIDALSDSADKITEQYTAGLSAYGSAQQTYQNILSKALSADRAAVDQQLRPYLSSIDAIASSDNFRAMPAAVAKLSADFGKMVSDPNSLYGKSVALNTQLAAAKENYGKMQDNLTSTSQRAYQTILSQIESQGASGFTGSLPSLVHEVDPYKRAQELAKDMKGNLKSMTTEQLQSLSKDHPQLLAFIQQKGSVEALTEQDIMSALGGKTVTYKDQDGNDVTMDFSGALMTPDVFNTLDQQYSLLEASGAVPTMSVVQPDGSTKQVPVDRETYKMNHLEAAMGGAANVYNYRKVEDSTTMQMAPEFVHENLFGSQKSATDYANLFVDTMSLISPAKGQSYDQYVQSVQAGLETIEGRMRNLEAAGATTSPQYQDLVREQELHVARLNSIEEFKTKTLSELGVPPEYQAVIDDVMSGLLETNERIIRGSGNHIPYGIRSEEQMLKSAAIQVAKRLGLPQEAVEPMIGKYEEAFEKAMNHGSVVTPMKILDSEFRNNYEKPFLNWVLSDKNTVASARKAGFEDFGGDVDVKDLERGEGEGIIGVKVNPDGEFVIHMKTGTGALIDVPVSERTIESFGVNPEDMRLSQFIMEAYKNPTASIGGKVEFLSENPTFKAKKGTKAKMKITAPTPASGTTDFKVELKDSDGNPIFEDHFRSQADVLLFMLENNIGNIHGYF